MTWPKIFDTTKRDRIQNKLKIYFYISFGETLNETFMATNAEAALYHNRPFPNYLNF